MSTTCILCGMKSQDYAIECSCCGNTYCSDRCKVQDHKVKFTHHEWHDYKRIYEQIINIDPKIRLVTICDINGKMMYSDYREGIENLLTSEESKKSLNLAVNAWKIRSILAPKIGKGKYVLAEYEKVKRITMPLGKNHLLYITTEVEADHSTIIRKTGELASQKQDYWSKCVALIESSAFGIVITPFADGLCQILHAEEYKRPDYNEMLSTVCKLITKYDVHKIYIDGANPSFIKSLKIRMGEEPDYDKVIDRYKSEGNSSDYWLQDMKIIPVNFNSEHKDMLANCEMVLEETGGHIAINPVFNKLITSLRTDKLILMEH